MKFVDDLFKLYKAHLTNTDEAAIDVVLTLFADHTREDLMRFIEELSDEEMFQMVSFYVIEMVKRKMSKEGLQPLNEGEIPLDPNLH